MKISTNNKFEKYCDNEKSYVLQAMDDNYTGTPWPQRLEEKFCETFGVEYSIACNSGTSGLHAAMYAIGVGSGDEVISPALTVIMDAYAIIHCGGTPVFADIDPQTMNINPVDVEKKITPKTKAILVVHLQGLPCDMEPILRLAKKHNLFVIEDSAQTVLGKYQGQIAGTIGHMGIYSFENKKHFTAGSEGGMIVTNDAELAVRARKFGGIGYKHMTAKAGRTSLALSDVQDPSYERFDTIGLNYRMCETSAAIALGQVERVHQLVERRQACAKMFEEAVNGCTWMQPQKTPKDCVNSYYTYAIKYNGEKDTGLIWKDFYNRYLEKGGDGFYGACKIPYLEPALKGLEFDGFKLGEGLCPVAENTQPSVMQFKTNYRNLKVCREKTKILSDLIDEIGR